MKLLKLLSSLVFVLVFSSTAFANTEFKGKETVNINKANAATFAAYFKGVGANKAKAIVKYRKANGRFKSIEDLKNVPGIGDETYKDIKRKASTSRGVSVAPEGYRMAESSGNSRSAKKKKIKKAVSKKRSESNSDSNSGKKRSNSNSNRGEKSNRRSGSDSSDSRAKSSRSNSSDSSSGKKKKKKKKKLKKKVKKVKAKKPK